MKVILKQEVDGLGDAGAVVKVADGYARNFLFPRNLAAIASEKNVKQLNHEKRMIMQQQERFKKEASDLAGKLQNVKVTISRQVGEEERIFGSVTSRDIADGLREEGFKISRRQVKFDENIKTTGTYNCEVKLHSEVSVPVQVWVVKQD